MKEMPLFRNIFTNMFLVINGIRSKIARDTRNKKTTEIKETIFPLIILRLISKLLSNPPFSWVFKKTSHAIVTLRLECNYNLRNCRFCNEKLNCWFFKIFSFQLDFVANLVQPFLFCLNWQFIQLMHTLFNKYNFCRWLLFFFSIHGLWKWSFYPVVNTV